MNILVTGATGFIGRRLVRALEARGDEVSVLSRDPARARAVFGERVSCFAWSPGQKEGAWMQAFARADGVVNLAGEPVMAHRWNDAVKARIRDSRVLGTRTVVDAMASLARRPAVLVNSSGADYYGDGGESELDESSPPGRSFLAQVCVAWEAEAQRAATLGVREVRLRTGVVLGEGGGALAPMARAFALFVGGPLGGGRQWMPWIHLDDMVAVFLAALDDARLTGAVNAVAPAPVRMRELAQELGRVLGRPSWAPVPGPALRLVLGEGAEALLDSKRVLPRALERAGFRYRHPVLAEALRAALGAAGQAR
jgi:uncharacterized protein (TIGR01777 family)